MTGNDPWAGQPLVRDDLRGLRTEVWSRDPHVIKAPAGLTRDDLVDRPHAIVFDTEWLDITRERALRVLWEQRHPVEQCVTETCWNVATAHAHGMCKRCARVARSLGAVV